MIKLLYPIGITLITVLSGLWLGEHQPEMSFILI